jgi:hypothetical protein
MILFCKCKEKDDKITMLEKNNEALSIELGKWTLVKSVNSYIYDKKYNHAGIVVRYEFKSLEETQLHIAELTDEINKKSLYIALLERMLGSEDTQICKEELNDLIRIKCKSEKGDA